MAEATLTVEFVNGPDRVPVTLTAENGNIRELLAAVRDELNIPGGANFLVNGAAADEDYILRDGDEVAATKPAGEKG